FGKEKQCSCAQESIICRRRARSFSRGECCGSNGCDLTGRQGFAATVECQCASVEDLLRVLFCQIWLGSSWHSRNQMLSYFWLVVFSCYRQMKSSPP
ncbi:hypothetical protein C0J52_00148, partial [Blattella germanica]